MIPEKLKIGDEVRIIAPSRSMKIIDESTINIAKERLKKMGLKVTFGKFVNECDDEYKCASIESRLSDLHEAFGDKNVKAILTAIGGFNCNQMLKYIDYNLIKNNPKIFCGFSDITALSNAIYAKTGLVTYSGLHFSSFGMKKGLEYSEEYFKKIFFSDDYVEVRSSETWSNDEWYIDQDNREFIKNEGMFVINSGEAEGKIIGGNLCTLNLLQGTEFMPDMSDKILFIEDDGLIEGDSFQLEFDRNLQSLIHLPNFKSIKALVIGRAEKNSNMTKQKWINIIKGKKELDNIPVIADCNFGHTTPIFTFPIGGDCILKANNDKIEISFK